MVINMWIKCDNDATAKLYDAEIMDEPVEFSDNGKAQVKKSVGKKLINKFGAIESAQETTSTYKNTETKSKGDE